MSPESTMHDHSTLLPYEAPRVIEDLPLETYSLACDRADGGKNPGECDVEGGFPNS